jgi:NTP pyrophosphatase (non-canonical NTP hydrolase)
MIMTANNYQEGVAKTLRAASPGHLVPGLVAEIGELCELYQKNVRDEEEITKDRVMSEAGDVLWYLTAILIMHGVSLEDCMRYNQKKLFGR